VPVRSYNYIKAAFAAKGFTLLSEEFINCLQKLKYKCSEGHINYVTFDYFCRDTFRCSRCAGWHKFTIEEVRAELAAEGYTLLSEEYTSSKKLLDCICPKGHKWRIRFYAWRHAGCRCAICEGNAPLNFDRVKKSFTDEGYVLLTEEYTNSKTKMDYICPDGHRGQVHWGNWSTGVRCGVCSYIQMCGSNSPCWRGGISCDPYCQDWTQQLKDYIKYRDGYRCLNTDCRSIDKEDLVVHHVDYNKKHCEQDNLVTVCRSCNGRANIDREWHTAWYQALLSMRYGYKY